jgi:hypothetical protein
MFYMKVKFGRISKCTNSQFKGILRVESLERLVILVIPSISSSIVPSPALGALDMGVSIAALSTEEMSQVEVLLYDVRVVFIFHRECLGYIPL